MIHHLTRAAARLREPLLARRSLPGVRRAGRSSRSGIALLLVVSIVALLTVIVTEVVHTASVRIQLAAAQRDEAKAEALAQGGVQFYRLILVASKQLEGNPMVEAASQFIPGGLNADVLWQLVPSISTNVLRLLLVTGGDEDEAQEIDKNGGLTDEQLDESREGASLKKPFLDFDGDFVASVVDEDGRIFVGELPGTDLNTLQRSPQGILLRGLMLGEREEEYLRESNQDRWDLIGNLADWTDLDDNRLFQGGRESALYDRGDDPYQPKNGPFDTLEELRLVRGWENDEVWRRYGQHLTIYGSGKVNVNTAPQKVLRAVINAHCNPQLGDDAMNVVLDMVQAYRRTPIAMGGGFFRKAQDFTGFVQSWASCNLDQGLSNAVKTKSTVFRVSSKGIVGKSTVEIEVVFDFEKSRAGKVVYWRIR